MDLAKPIDLTADRAKLSDEMTRLARREQNVYENTGVECEIKWLDGGNRLSCSTCPHSRAHAPEGGGPLGAICRIGLAQEKVQDQLDRHREVEELEELAARAFLADECDELAELTALVA